ncbi:MAG: hypothetical protein GWN00_35905, partial [Aliifodinibius sp.]|nr:hypothetical protein [Fodinibius sp.]NIV16024.1 hypothetical protein [Fodinibius sp.]NIY29980.1 hypothetical protein [Fodinibius sp.]
ILQENITFSNYIKIVCREHITVSGSARLKNVILYSPQRITISNNRHFQGQLYSEEKIVIRDQVKLHYPSIAMVYSRSDTGSIHISSGSEISGSVIYVTRDKPPIPTH